VLKAGRWMGRLDFQVEDCLSVFELAIDIKPSTQQGLSQTIMVVALHPSRIVALCRHLILSILFTFE